MHKNLKNALLLGAVVALSGSVKASGYDYSDFATNNRGDLKKRMSEDGKLMRSDSASNLWKLAEADAKAEADETKRESTFNNRLTHHADERNKLALDEIKRQRAAYDLTVAVPNLDTLHGHDRILVSKNDQPITKASEGRPATQADILNPLTVLYVQKTGSEKVDSLDTNDTSASAYGVKASDVIAYRKAAKDAQDAKDTMWDEDNNAVFDKTFAGLTFNDNPYSFNPGADKWKKAKKLYDEATGAKPANFDRATAEEFEKIAQYGLQTGIDIDAELKDKHAQGGLVAYVEGLLQGAGLGDDYAFMTEADESVLKKQKALNIGLTNRVKALEAAQASSGASSADAATLQALRAEKAALETRVAALEAAAANSGGGIPTPPALGSGQKGDQGGGNVDPVTGLPM